MSEQTQSLSFQTIDISDLSQVTKAYEMRCKMYVANGDPYTMSDHRFPDLKAYAQYLGNHQNKEFIVIDNNSAGFYAYSFNHKKNPDGGYVHMIYLDDKHRAKGYGHRIFDRIISHCKRENIASLVLHSKKENQTNQEIYTKLGFKCLGNVDDSGFLLKWEMIL